MRNPNNVNYARTSISAVVKIYDDSFKLLFDNVPVVSVTIEYSLGGVPEANFVLNVGDDAKTRKLAEVHARSGEFTQRLKMECLVQLNGEEVRGRKWPGGTLRIWLGAITGLAYGTQPGVASITLSSAHWVSDLDASSLSTQSLVKNDAANLLVSLGVPSGSLGTTGTWLGIAGSITRPPSGKPMDLWSDVLLQMLLAAMGQSKTVTLRPENFATTLTGTLARCNDDIAIQDLVVPGNPRAADLIRARFNLEKSIVPGKLPLFSAIVNERLAGSEQLTSSIVDYIAALLLDSLGNASALDRILSVAAAMNVSLVTNTESATLAPTFPLYDNSVYWRTVESSEYSTVDGRGVSPRRLAGVVMTGQLSSYTGATPTPAQGVGGTVVGAFRGLPDGQFDIVTAPSWLRVPNHINAKRGKEAVRDFPGTENVPDPNAAIPKLLDAYQIGACALARVLWANRVYGGRSCSISGRLRFDIAPGSVIRLGVVGKGLPQVGNGYMIAFVNAVRVVIDSQTGSASTVLSLSHLRGSSETTGTSMVHPIFGTRWCGSPLVAMRRTDLTPEKP